ncbi:MAG: transglutaminase domain-containing protein [Methylomonas sp.]|jgi:transglutaminase-like putative cysteine protease|uniref:transglutaminase-like domain-containing protein n=1 Tax=Methylomonas sp. TaxID=418 RepID=UPI0025E1AB3F|nr:transglutaminase domain-containing protein [Methylomonas sp.]MCK9609226.1 transglutaminase domain-containing protein [Methylomonas sp.]
MSPRQCLPKIRQLIVTALSVVAALSVTDALAQQPETPEIIFSTSDAQPLADTAAQLGNAVAIYEYVRNHFDYAAYHGSRSGSINTFLGQRGSDVDIATTLIAMLRSQNIPARYAVGTVRIPSAQMTNWLGVGNPDVAVQILKDQGIQGVVLAADRSTVDLEHVWTEALVPFSQYRGLPTGTSVDCTLAANSSQCNWIPLDGSFKQKAYNDLNIDPYNALSFDYTGYYNAIKDAETDPLLRKDKNPLTILEEQIATWLRANHPGKTLEDVADAGRIIETRDGLLPASLPYPVISTIRRYDSVALHDAVVPADEPKTWAKSLAIDITILTPSSSTPVTQMGSVSLLLAQLNTKRLTLTTEFPAPGNTPNMVFRLGGTEIARPISGNGSIPGYIPTVGDPFTITLSMDGRPDPSSGGDDFTITAEYAGIVGGYYLLGTGGEYSNWSLVDRAADQLLADNSHYKIVFDPSDPGSNGQACDVTNGLNCTPYVDITGNGWDSSDPPLLQYKPALDDLTGGLLYVAATQYYAKLREQVERADQLMKTKTPIVGFLGVVSSVYDVEYIGDTAFAVLPGGLLIDMKGITVSGAYRTQDAPLTYSNRQFEFMGHIGSSLEHEVWQELTGYDAVSTVRGIQMALASGASLLNPLKNNLQDTLPALYDQFQGFSTTVPAGFGYTTFTINNTTPAAWTHATAGANFDAFLKTVNTATDVPHLYTWSYVYSPTNGLYGWSSCTANKINEINTLYPWRVPIGYTTCDGTNMSYFLHDDALNTLYSNWANNIVPNIIGQDFFNFFDTQQGFSPSTLVYRNNTANSTAYPSKSLAGVRNDLYLRDLNQSWVEYVIPSTLVPGPNNRFEVYIRKGYLLPNDELTSINFKIVNHGN